MKKFSAFILILLSLFINTSFARLTLRYPPERWLDDNDKTPIKKPAKTEGFHFWDPINYQIVYQFRRLIDVQAHLESLASYLVPETQQEALNVNHFDEVVDSTWFVNRIGRYDLTENQLLRKDAFKNAPDKKGKWAIVYAKTIGKSPGFIIVDEKGDRYLLKFDPQGWSELATGAEMISTLFYHAIGYHVPKNFIVNFSKDKLVISPKAKTRDDLGREKPFTQAMLEETLNKAAVVKPGTYRALASLFLEGEAMGPIVFVGTRPHDKNDRISHQHRRELRGLQVFASFLDHTDPLQSNTLDTFIVTTTDGRGYVKHHLLDFGATLGSATSRPKTQSHRYRYYFDYREVFGRLLSLGLYRPQWEKISYETQPLVGFFEAEHFDPEDWRPTYPIPPFQRMTFRDAFWAAKILMRFSDEDIKKITRMGQFSNPEAAEYIAKTLIQRRDKIGKTWFGKVNPLDDFHLETKRNSLTIHFDDLPVKYSFKEAAHTEYRYRIKKFKSSQKYTKWQIVAKKPLEIHLRFLNKVLQNQIFRIEIQTRRVGEKFFGPSLELYVKKRQDYQIMGLERKY